MPALKDKIVPYVAALVALIVFAVATYYRSPTAVNDVEVNAQPGITEFPIAVKVLVVAMIVLTLWKIVKVAQIAWRRRQGKTSGSSNS